MEGELKEKSEEKKIGSDMWSREEYLSQVNAWETCHVSEDKIGKSKWVGVEGGGEQGESKETFKKGGRRGQEAKYFSFV